MKASQSIRWAFNMLSLKSRGGIVKIEVPKALYMAIVRLQAAESLDWEDACARAAQLIDANSAEFGMAVKREAQRLYNRRFMEQLNKALASVKEKAWNEGFEAGYDEALYSIFELEEKHLSKHGLGYALCQHCGKPLYGVLVAVNQSLGKWVLEKVREAGWGHTECHEKAKAKQF